jgi:histidyl-tRNA synthetase
MQPIRGTKDILPQEQLRFNSVINIAKRVASQFGYDEITLPIMEFTEIFKRTLGDYSDVVNKEMYSFQDRSENNITLRPEFTAQIARMVISEGLFHKLPQRFFTWGPLFRYERPQKGRQRQFNQINYEFLGQKEPIADVETILVAIKILSELGIEKDVILNINTLGDNASRANYIEELSNYFSKYKNDLSEESKIRLDKNPLRILDSKDDFDKKICSDAPVLSNFLNFESKNFFDNIILSLTKLGVNFKINDKLVRGLDYYSHTVFEFITEKLGAQGTVLAGGRYDGLFKIMCNKDIPAVGFASGVERISELMTQNIMLATSPDVYIIPDSQDAFIAAAIFSDLAVNSRNLNIKIADCLNSSKAIKRAIDDNSRFAAFITTDNAKSNQVKIRDLKTRQEQTIGYSEAVEVIYKNRA